MSENYFIMLHEPAWAGPVARRTSQWDQVLNLGEELAEDPGLFEFQLEVDANAPDPKQFPPLDWHDPEKGHTLFSKRMRDLLQELGVDNIDYYPTRMIYPVTGETCDHQVANIIGSVHFLDTSLSDFVEDEDGFIEEIFNMVFDESKAHGLKFFRLYELENLIVVHKTVKEGIENAELTGMKFLKDSDWEPGII
jgi:hypothetical protein